MRVIKNVCSPKISPLSILFIPFFLILFHYSLAYAVGEKGMSTDLKISILNSTISNSTIPNSTIPKKLNAADLQALPRISINNLQYAGAFRIRAGTYGGSRTGFSTGKVAYNEAAHSLFMTGHVYDSAIAEFAIPELVNSAVVTDLNLTDRPTQDFVKLLAKVKDKNTQNIDRLGGMEFINGELLVQIYTYYDAAANNTHTSLLIRDATDMQNSSVDGFFEMQGRAHLVLWLAPIPDTLKELFQGDYIAGSSNAIPINGRSSMGPSAFVLQSSDFINTQKNNSLINTIKLLDFSLKNIMADTAQGWLPFSKGWSGAVQYNYSGNRTGGDVFGQNYDINLVGNNTLWTEASSAAYGLMIPGTRTYAVFGSSGMHNSGGGYKIRQKNGRLCGGPCAYDPADSDNYYWFFDMSDLYQVKAGTKQSYEVKPYEYGVFKTPLDTLYDTRRKVNYGARIGGGTYNSKDGLIYFSLPSADRGQSYYEPPSIIMAYKVVK